MRFNGFKANYFVQELDEPVRVNRLRTGC